MESNYLDEMKNAYDENFVFDNKLSLEWYPGRVAELAQGNSMLELGLGHGYSTAFFAKHFDRYVVLEGSDEMIDRFRERFPIKGVEIVKSWFEEFDTAERFDHLGMGFILEHVEDPGVILRRFAKFLNPGGSIFIAVPNAESLHRRLGHEAGLLPDITSLSEADLQFGHRRYFTLKTLTELAEESGYKLVAAEGIFLKPVTTSQLISLNLSDEILQALLKVGTAFPQLCNSLLVQIERHEN